MEKTLCNTAPNTLMTLDEAIQHCIEKSEGCTQCAKEHQQLKFWLEELKFLRGWYRKWYAPIDNVVQVDMGKIGNNTIEEAGTFCKDAVKANDKFSVYNTHPEYLEKAQKIIVEELYFKS